MSKTSKELKAKKAKEFEKEKIVEEVSETTGKQKAQENVTPPESETTKKVTNTEKKTHLRSKKYQTAKKNIDVLKFYPLKEAVKLVKQTSISKFDGKVEAHLSVSDIGTIGEITFPYLDTASKKIVILDDKILAELKDGKINFDIILATPATMPKLLPFARFLGPKGLMPNPKNGTLTEKPEETIRKLAVAKTSIKTEKKAPLVHIIVGKVSQPESELEANVAELIKIIKAPKIKKLSLSATMGPSVKVMVEK